MTMMVVSPSCKWRTRFYHYYSLYLFKDYYCNLDEEPVDKLEIILWY